MTRRLSGYAKTKVAVIFFNCSNVLVIHNRVSGHLHLAKKLYMKKRRKLKVRH